MKSLKIQELVQSMRAGKISKADLFTQLSQLQRESKEQSPDRSKEEVEGFVESKMESNKREPERRAMIIEKLFQEKRRMREQEQQEQLEKNNLKKVNVETGMEGRMRRLAEEQRTKQMAECTFSPSIRELPIDHSSGRLSLSHSSDQPSFQERVDKWKQKRLIESERKRAAKESEELQGCTFTPKITFRPSTPDGRGKDHQERDTSAHERLYQQSKLNKRASLQAQARAEKEEELARLCTFKPEISSKDTDYAPVRSRYQAASPSRLMSSASSASSLETNKKQAWDKELTFTPHTNPIKPEMESAQSWLRKNVVSRLHQPLGTHPRKQIMNNNENNDRSNDKVFDNYDESGVIDVTQFLSQVNNKPASIKRPGSAGPRIAEPVKMTKEETAERRKSFETFINRQQQLEKRKQHKLEQTSKKIEPTYAPQLCKKSVEIVSENHRGTFLERVANGALRKEHEAVRIKSQNHDPQCTFSPSINESSKRKPARSAVDMSRGDSLKKETKARIAKLKLEQEELDELTFKPEINNFRGVESALKVVSEPESYIKRLEQKNQLHSTKQDRAVLEQERKELEECTFKPKIHDAPVYVKRIVRSLALAKPSKEALYAAQRDAKQDWR